MPNTRLRAGFDQSGRDGEDFSYDKRWRLLTGAPCLALDELTAFSVTPWAAERFERLIDERWRGMPQLLTICAFNGSDEAPMQSGLPTWWRAGCVTGGRSGSTWGVWICGRCADRVGGERHRLAQRPYV